MFDFPGDAPTSFDRLRDDLEHSVRKRIDLPREHQAVTVEGDAWPHGSLLRVLTTGGTVEVDDTTGGLPDELKPPTLARGRTPGPRFETFVVEAEPLVADVAGGGRLPLHLRVDGQHVGFDFGRDVNGTTVMAPASGDAVAVVGVERDDLLRVVKTKATSEAAARGVTLSRVEADVSSPDARTLLVTGKIGGTKKVAFFNASFLIDFAIDFVAEADPTGELVGRVRDVKLRGDGTIMNLLLSLATPVIDKAKRRPLPLRDVLAMAGVQGLKLRDVAVQAGDRLELRATFGDAGP